MARWSLLNNLHMLHGKLLCSLLLYYINFPVEFVTWTFQISVYTFFPLFPFSIFTQVWLRMSISWLCLNQMKFLLDLISRFNKKFILLLNKEKTVSVIIKVFSLSFELVSFVSYRPCVKVQIGYNVLKFIKKKESSMKK